MFVTNIANIANGYFVQPPLHKVKIFPPKSEDKLKIRKSNRVCLRYDYIIQYSLDKVLSISIHTKTVIITTNCGQYNYYGSSLRPLK